MAPIPDGNRDEPNRSDSDISDLETPQVTIELNSESSSSEDEASPYMGYELLPQDPEAGGEGEAVNHVDVSTEELPDFGRTTQWSLESQGQQNAAMGLAQNIPPTPNTAAEERRSVWSKAPPLSQPMDPDQVIQIKSAMANFKLPTPDWAKAIPEDAWKEQLFQRLTPAVNTAVKDSSVKEIVHPCNDCTNEQQDKPDLSSQSVKITEQNSSSLDECGERSAVDDVKM